MRRRLAGSGFESIDEMDVDVDTDYGMAGRSDDWDRMEMEPNPGSAAGLVPPPIDYTGVRVGSDSNGIDEDEGAPRFVQSFPEVHRAGAPIDPQKYKTTFETVEEEAAAQGGGAYSPFRSDDEAELAEWLFENVSLGKIDEFLKLRIVRNACARAMYCSMLTLLSVRSTRPRLYLSRTHTA